MDDIVARLRQFVKRCNHDWNLGNEWYPAPTECVSCALQRESADEIERLREDRDRWRKIADALVEAADIQVHLSVIRQQGPWYSQHLTDAITQYQEAQK